MKAFFNGWRRKIGIVTLLMACAFAGLWIRSFKRGDIFTSCLTGLRSTNIEFASCHGRICGILETSRFPSELSYESLEVEGVLDMYRNSEWDDKWKWRAWGFAYGESLNPNHKYCCVPYWSIVLPLTLLSADLLLSNPRTMKPPEATNPHDKVQVPHA